MLDSENTQDDQNEAARDAQDAVQGEGLTDKLVDFDGNRPVVDREGLHEAVDAHLEAGGEILMDWAKPYSEEDDDEDVEPTPMELATRYVSGAIQCLEGDSTYSKKLAVLRHALMELRRN